MSGIEGEVVYATIWMMDVKATELAKFIHDDTARWDNWHTHAEQHGISWKVLPGSGYLFVLVHHKHEMWQSAKSRPEFVRQLKITPHARFLFIAMPMTPAQEQSWIAEMNSQQKKFTSWLGRN